MRDLKAVLLDMDGTLLDSEKLWDISLEQLAEHLGGTLRPEIREAMIGCSMRESLGLLYDDIGLGFDEEKAQESGEWLRQATAAIFDRGMPWRPGARELLDAIAAEGIPMVLVTNTERFLADRALHTLGRERFAATICGDEVPHGKPAPDIYRAAAALVDATPEDCLAIEDSPTGVRAAEAAGCPVLVVPCEVPVADGPRRSMRDTLVGLSVAELRDRFATLSLVDVDEVRA